MEAQAQMRFSTGRVELFGLANFAGAFNVPGVVTIGPNLRITGVNIIAILHPCTHGEILELLIMF
jgi:hypothetical protein